MQAYVRLDSVGQIVELAEVAAPAADAEEVVVAVHAFGVGVHDRYFIPPDVSFPYTIGLEAAGVVTAVGAGVTEITLGDRVMVSGLANPKGGTWAEFVAADQHGIRAMPDELDFVTAAGIPIAGAAAVESMHTLSMGEGQTPYVAGASGAIGTLVVQMALEKTETRHARGKLVVKVR